MPSVWRTLVFGALLACACLGLSTTTVLADGIPTPLPGATGGPTLDTIKALVAANGMTCQPISLAGAPVETFCQRKDPSGLILSVTYFENPLLVLEAVASGTDPLPPEADAFLNAMAAPFCAPADVAGISRAITDARSTTSDVVFENDVCRISAFALVNAGNAVEIVDSFAKIVPPTPAPSATAALATPAPTQVPTPTSAVAGASEPAPTPVPTIAPSPTPAASVTIVVPLNVAGPTPGAFVTSIPAPSQVSREPLVIAQSAILAILVLLLMPFPAQLFNSTLEENYAEVRGWFRLDRIAPPGGRLQRFWGSALGVVVFVLLAALIYAQLDPRWTPDAGGFTTVAGLALGIAAAVLVGSAALLVYARRRHDAWHVRALPATLVVAVICVLISRLAGFLPGYVYGAIIGVVVAQELATQAKGTTAAVAGAVMLVAAIAAWVALGAMDTSAAGAATTLISTVLAATMVACLEGVVFGLLPFRFLPGESLYRTRRVVWAVLLGLGAFLFFHILINPSSGYLSDTSRTPFLTVVGLFVAFGLGSVLFWAYFRRRPRHEVS